MKDTIYAQVGDTLTMVGDSISISITATSEGTTHEAEGMRQFFSMLYDTLPLGKIGIVLLLGFILLSIVAMQTSVLKFFTRNLGKCALLIWFLGFVLYLYGFFEGGTAESASALVARAAISALEMFASHSDLIEVRECMHHDGIYMLFFSLTHLVAVCISALFVINMFGLSLMNGGRRIWWWLAHRIKSLATSNKLSAFPKVYVFWNVTDEALIIAKEMKNKGRIVFVVDNDNTSSGHSLGRHFSFGNFLDFSTENKEQIDHVITHFRGYVLKNKTANSLSQIGFLFKKSRVHLLFTSDDEKRNIDNMIFLKSNPLFDNENITFHCHARKNLTNERLTVLSNYISFVNEKGQTEWKQKGNGMGGGLRLIDSSYLSVLELKQNETHHPVNFVDIKTDSQGRSTGIVTSKFSALVIGFSHTGQEALDFLYEFSAFVGEDGCRSPHRIVAIDKNIASLKGNYLAERPALRSNPHLEFVAHDINSEAYQEYIEALIKDGLNYVVISLGNDRLNLSVAMQLFECAQRFGRTLDEATGSQKFCIYFRQKERVDESVKALYNAAALKPFGSYEKIFTEDIIFNEAYEDAANKYNEKYNELKAIYEDKDPTAPEDKTPSKSLLEKMRDDKRKFSQNLSNAYHRHTKTLLIGRDRIEQLKDYERSPKNVGDYKGGYTYKRVSSEDENSEVTALMTTLAQCEHLRWNAAMEILGYTQNTKDRSGCNLITMEHNCLTTWEDLLNIWKEFKGKKQYSEYRQYDYGVVETSIKLYLSDLKKKGNDGQGDNRGADKS